MISLRKGMVAAIALGVYGIAAGPGAGQERRTDRPPPRGADAAEDPADRAGTQIRGRTEVQTRGAFLQASTLIGMQVQVAEAERIGVVKDVLIDPRTCVQYVLLDAQGVVEVDGFIVVPWELFEFPGGVVARESALVLSVPVTRLRTAPVISSTRVDLAFSAPWVNEVTTFYEAELRERRSARPDLDDRDPGARRRGDRPGTRTPDGERPRTPRSDNPPNGDPAPGTPPRTPRTPPRSDDDAPPDSPRRPRAPQTPPGTREPQPPDRDTDEPRPREPQPQNPTPEAPNP